MKWVVEANETFYIVEADQIWEAMEIVAKEVAERTDPVAAITAYRAIDLTG